MIQVGQVLDKYELLERVGQGGMAIVYRGLDRTLKRVVAIKILHKHLADYQEARDRFEREAQAVAKLRHENILEIFDYAAKDEAEAYIVTEFIDGQTLKQVITERPIAFPEIGAMVILQVGRALAHAHAGGILHRDVKPENIMIRSDGVVKLMDFGISHMVDLERLTVTGQLLGSPAYMAPEHVEGRPIDYRTDVFAAGIVLYQLCVGKLPFEGKNPHEVLKRIAECKFVDPRTANPRIGNRLGRIILRAMAASPDDRYPAIGEMVVALEGYLEESGIASDKIAGELARYFQAPAAYEQALEERLIDHLTRRGQKLLAEDERPAALDLFDRVLTIDPDNEKVIGILDGINRRLRYKAIGVGMLAAGVIGLGAFMIHRRSKPPGADVPALLGATSATDSSPLHVASTRVAPDDPAPPVPVPIDADAGVVAAASDAAVVPDTGSGLRPPPSLVDAGTVAQEARIQVSPAQDSELDFGDGHWVPVLGEDGNARAIEHDVTVRVRNPCCVPTEQVIHPGQGPVMITLELKPGSITPLCDWPGATVSIDGNPATLGKSTDVFFKKGTLLTEKFVTVEFLSDTKVEKQRVRVPSGGSPKVTCGQP